MKKTLTKYGQLACLLSFIYIGVAGCTKEDNATWEQGTEKVRITGHIEDAVTVQSRAEQPVDQFGSYRSGGFQEGEQIGFYSVRDNDGNTPGFSNECLTYTSTGDKDGYQTFSSEELDPNKAAYWGHVFAYYPYNGENEDNEIDIYDESGKVIDLLIADSPGPSGGVLNFSFRHAFSMLFIIPGEAGFSQATTKNPDGITVVLKKGVEKVTVNSGRTNITPTSSTEEAHTRFTAQINTKALKEGMPASSFFYVLLPNGVEIDHIELIDDFDRKQYVYPSETITLERGKRHFVRLQMIGDEPTIWPWKFTEWNSVEVEVDRNPGINTTEDLEAWITAYNGYCNEEVPDPEGTTGQILKKYGDYNETTEGKWTFFLRNDIDCTGFTFGSYITTFGDVLDGLNHTISHVTLSGETPGFIGTLTEGGILQRLKLEDVHIQATQADAPAGAFANQMTGGTITDCTLNGFNIEAQGPVGAIVGTATGGSITNNTYKNGTLTGTVSNESNYIVGTTTETVTFKGNRYADVLFRPISNNDETSENE